MGILRLFIWGFVSSIIFACSSGTGNAVSNLQINGIVQSGNLNSSQPLSGYMVNLYAITESSTNYSARLCKYQFL